MSSTSSSSDPSSGDEIDRTVTPGQEIPIRRQKRSFEPNAIQDIWVEGQKDILLKLKDGTRIISPRTVDVVNDLINQCDAALTEESKTEYFHELVEGIQIAMPFLTARLETDDKYAEELEAFQQLACHRVLLRYGDYYADALNTVRSLVTGPEKILLKGRRWDEVLDDVEKEKAAEKEWADNGEKGPKPDQPVLTLLYNVSLLWKDFGVKALIDMIGECVVRNGIAHNGLNEAIKARKWIALALHLRRDYHDVQTLYPLEKDKEKVELLKSVIESCQKKFFVFILDDVVYGQVEIKNCQMHDKIIQEEIEIFETKKKAEDIENAEKLKKLLLSDAKEDLSDAGKAALKASQQKYEDLVDQESKRRAKVKKQKVENKKQKGAAADAIKAAKEEMEKAAGKK